MSQLTGHNYIGSTATARGASTFQSVDPTRSVPLEPAFYEATAEEIHHACTLAATAFETYRQTTPQRRATFLRAIATEIEAAGDALIERAVAESALPTGRITGERGRTTGQLRMFATMIEEGSWVGARIDHADPNRKPLPKSDIRRMVIPVGPVVVFEASNFPLAFSAGGGDTASALAAGCPVILKTHPSHPGTSEMVMAAVLRAAAACAMPEGVISMIHGRDPAVSVALVKHPAVKAVGFTGSLRAGRALFDVAAARPEPIPVYAEMGSINPVFLLPGAVAERGAAIAEGLKNSVTLGVGQFCTNPGLVLSVDGSQTEALLAQLATHMASAAPGSMLNAGICQAFTSGAEKMAQQPGVKVAARAATPAKADRTEGAPVLFTTDGKTFLNNHALSEELFGPSTLLVTAGSPDELEAIARALPGQLTATIHGTPADLVAHRGLVEILANRAGRLIFNGYPTGVEVCHAMQHGGPYPATTDARSTSVGSAAIDRFVRPVCYQDFPEEALPPELQESNPRNLWRIVDGELKRA